MWSRDELAKLSLSERNELLRTLLSLGVRPVAPRLLWRRRAFLTSAMLAAAAVLTAWLIYLGFALPGRQEVDGWRIAWIGIDVIEVAAIVTTAWAAWRYRQIVIVASVVTGTLLFCDAWFDVALAWGSSGWVLSIALAVLVEIPAGIMLWETARRLFLATVSAARATLGLDATLPPLRRLGFLLTTVAESPAAPLRPR